jgi:CheY-like chemotaxis protein
LNAISLLQLLVSQSYQDFMNNSAPNKHILIVEDDLDTSEVLALVLAGEEYQVSTAVNGIEAIELLVSLQFPALILLDLKMPKMNGWEFIAAIKQSSAYSSIPVVIISADNNSRFKAAQMGATAYITKPLEFDLLLNTICLLVSGHAV